MNRSWLSLGMSLIGLALFLSGCAWSYHEPSYVSRSLAPQYVEVTADGCWADRAWFAPCPWMPGAAPGYYRLVGGSYVWVGPAHPAPPVIYVQPAPVYLPPPVWYRPPYRPAHPHVVVPPRHHWHHRH